MRDLHQPHPRVAGRRASLFALVLLAAAPWPAMVAADDPAYVDGAAGQAAPDPANADQRRPAPPPMADAGQQAQAIPIADADAAGPPMTPEARYLMQQQLAAMQQQMQAAAGAAETGAAPILPAQPAADGDEPAATAANHADPQALGEAAQAATPMDGNNTAPASDLTRAIGAGLAQDAARAVSARMQREILGERHGTRILVDPREMPLELPPARAEAGWPGEE